jgi:cell division transport system permease protein
MAILLLLVAKVAFIDPFKHEFSLITATDTVNFGVLVMILLVASVAVSAAGSGLSLRRFLRV